MIQVVLQRDVVTYLNELVDILYEEDYFGFRENAFEYVDDIFYQVKNNLHKLPSKEAPQYYSKYGSGLSYATYRKNKNTQWYVFFFVSDNVYYVQYIANNHTEGQHL